MPYINKDKNVEEDIETQTLSDLYHKDVWLNCSGMSRVAFVACFGEKSCDSAYDEALLNYEGLEDCEVFLNAHNSTNDCPWKCVGFGNCVKSCPRSAISIQNHTAVILSNCNGCGVCLESCPQNLIRITDALKPEAKICNLPEGINVNCSECNSGKNKNPVILEKRNVGLFQFWQNCYKLFSRDR